jgi:hypothetical protein
MSYLGMIKRAKKKNFGFAAASLTSLFSLANDTHGIHYVPKCTLKDEQ